MAGQHRGQAKKLTEAARWWAGVREEPEAGDFEVDDSILEAMQAMGAPPEDIEATRARIAATAPPAPEQPQAFGVWPENWPTVMAFVALGTQWQHAGMNGQRTGLNYPSLWGYLDRHIRRPRKRKAMEADLRLMERAALNAWAEMHQAEQAKQPPESE